MRWYNGAIAITGALILAGCDRMPESSRSDARQQQDATGSPLSVDVPVTSIGDKAYLREISALNHFLVEASKIAVTESTTPEIQHFAERAINDYQGMSNRLDETVGERADDTPILSSQADQLDHLRNTSSGFDSAYVRELYDASKRIISLSRNYMTKGENANLRDYAKLAGSLAQSRLQQIDELPV